VNVPVLYGSTEAGGISIPSRDVKCVGTTGAPFTDIVVKLVDWEEGKYFASKNQGEILAGGRAISVGYFKTKEDAIHTDDQGMRWWSSGDIGELMPDGSLKIIDRKKDLIKLSIGEYISLGKIEAELKACPVIDNICVFGRLDRDFVVAVVVPVMRELNEVAKKVGVEGERLLENEMVVSSATKQIQEFGCKAGLTRIEVPKKIKITSESWTPDNGLVTAALKIRRRQIQDFYCKDIDSMFNNNL